MARPKNFKDYKIFDTAPKFIKEKFQDDIERNLIKQDIKECDEKYVKNLLDEISDIYLDTDIRILVALKMQVQKRQPDIDAE